MAGPMVQVFLPQAGCESPAVASLVTGYVFQNRLYSGLPVLPSELPLHIALLK
jgi:hypothetical protein